MNQSSKTVYIPMSADLIHPGHIKIIKAGAELGYVTIGLLTDETINTKKKRSVIMSYGERFEVISNIKGVSNVISQDVSDYRPNLLKLKSNYVVHGDDWSSEAKQQVIETLSAWGGELFELPYTKGISSTEIRQRILKNV